MTKGVLTKLPPNTLLAAKIDQKIYDSSVANGWEVFPRIPPFSVVIYFFPADVYLLDYENKNISDCYDMTDGVLTIEFRFFIKQLLKQDLRLLSFLHLDEAAYFYKDFYGRALLDYNYLFFPESFDAVAVNKMVKEILYDYVVANHTDK